MGGESRAEGGEPDILWGIRAIEYFLKGEEHRGSARSPRPAPGMSPETVESDAKQVAVQITRILGIDDISAVFP